MELFAVQVTATALVLGEDANDAQRVASQCSDEIISDCIDLDVAYENEIPDEKVANAYGYPPDALVYHEGSEDISVRDALESIRNS